MSKKKKKKGNIVIDSVKLGDDPSVTIHTVEEEAEWKWKGFNPIQWCAIASAVLLVLGGAWYTVS